TPRQEENESEKQTAPQMGCVGWRGEHQSTHWGEAGKINKNGNGNVTCPGLWRQSPFFNILPRLDTRCPFLVGITSVAFPAASNVPYPRRTLPTLQVLRRRGPASAR